MKKIKCEIYTRVVGYFRPVQNWNEGKSAEFNDRKEFCEETSLKTGRSLSDKKLEVVETPAETAATIEISANKPARYEIFTMPNCEACASIKAMLSLKKLQGCEFDLSDSDGLKRVRSIFRDHRDHIHRNEDGSMPVPLVLFYDQENHLRNIVQRPEDLERIA